MKHIMKHILQLALVFALSIIVITFFYPDEVYQALGDLAQKFLFFSFKIMLASLGSLLLFRYLNFASIIAKAEALNPGSAAIATALFWVGWALIIFGF